MSTAEVNQSSVGALQKTVKLFRPDVDPVQQNAGVGYIDVLGDVDVISPLKSHQVFRRKRFPLIYERLWRPLVSRSFFGVFGIGPRRERRIALGMLNVSPGDRVIDIGCGPGNYTKRLAGANGGELVVGVDASEAMLAAAAKDSSAPNLAYVRGDACALPFEDGQFDAACSVGAIHMTENPMAALAEMVRMLAPGGRLCILATCGPAGQPSQIRNGITIFAPSELPDALVKLGLHAVKQQVTGHAQFVSAERLGQ